MSYIFTIISRILDWLEGHPTVAKQIFIPPMQTPPTTPNLPPTAHKSRIPDWANAIKVGEGAALTLNNPGNLKISTLTKSWGGTPGRQATDGGWLCKFATYDQGFQALCNLLTLAAENELISYHQARTFEAFTKIYAGNPPQQYIQGIADRLGITLNTDISTLL